jgi:hypothetical protein
MHVNPKEGSDMRAHRVVLSFATSILATFVACGVASAQEYRGTMEQQMACTPDVLRLCGAQIPDVNRIVACLQQNTPQLSGACRAVFDSSASSNTGTPQQSLPQQSVPRRRDFQ